MFRVCIVWKIKCYRCFEWKIKRWTNKKINKKIKRYYEKERYNDKKDKEIKRWKDKEMNKQRMYRIQNSDQRNIANRISIKLYQTIRSFRKSIWSNQQQIFDSIRNACSYFRTCSEMRVRLNELIDHIIESLQNREFCKVWSNHIIISAISFWCHISWISKRNITR